MPQITLERVASVVDTVPVVQLQVVSTVDFPEDIFKYKVSDTGTDIFQEVCTLEDIESLGTVRTGGAIFYRRKTAQVEFSSLSLAIDGKTDLVNDVDNLLSSYVSATTEFLGTDQLVLEG